MTQTEALDILKLGHNVFLTGPAGSGKTYLLNQFIGFLKKQGIPVGVTASTGIAATHMGGTTIHSFTGLGIKDSLTPKDLTDLLKKQYLRKHFFKTKVLIIDEISMLHSNQLDMVDQICKAFKKNQAPFGGMQVIMCGDFFQLPPIERKKLAETSSTQEVFAFKNSDSPFAYNASIWQDMQLEICYLDEQYRQSDRAFLTVLNDIRNGEVTDSTVEYLSERLKKEPEGYTRPTRLFTHNTDVDTMNSKHLQELVGEAKEFIMYSRGSLGIVEGLRRSCLAPEKLVLKKGAQVMFVKNNYEEGYVNGTLGEVIDFSKDGQPLVRTFDGSEITVGQVSWEVKEDDVELAAISQIPLRLAWAITVHKSQGMSLDAAEIDLSRSFVPGQGYVALSRLRSLQGLKLIGMNQMALTVNPEVSEMDRKFREKSDEAILNMQSLGLDKKQKLQEEYLTYLKHR